MSLRESGENKVPSTGCREAKTESEEGKVRGRHLGQMEIRKSRGERSLYGHANSNPI